MSDFKFNCPSCGQRLSGDERYAGLQINCPACGTPVMVPAAPAHARLAGPAGPPPVPRGSVPGGPSHSAPGTPQKTCGLAIASLICSIGSFIIIPLGFIPGIICGHMARKKIATTPGLLGAGMAKAGLIIGYISLGLTAVVAMAVAAFLLFFGVRVSQVVSSIPTSRSVGSAHSRGAAPAEGTTTDTAPDGSGWTMKLAGMETPSGALTGRVHGQPFKLDKVTLESGWLDFGQGTDFFADLEVDVVLFENDAAKLSGRTFIEPKEESGVTPHVWVKWKQEGQSAPEQGSYTHGYAMRLELGTLADGKLPGKIYLCLPDKQKSFIAGTFEAQLKGKP